MAKAISWMLKKKVLPQHTDHAGVMWHGAYLDWLEEARIDSLFQVGISYADLSLEGYEMPVVDLRIKYLRALKHGENVVLKSRLLPRKGVKSQWQTLFLKENGEWAAEALVVLVLVERVKSDVRVLRKTPDHIAKAFSDIEKGPLTN